MKEKNFRITFFIIVILITVFSIYYIVKNKEKVTNNPQMKKIEEKTINTIILGTTDFDTINPITTLNSDIQYISKLIYEPLIEITNDFRLKEAIAIEWAKLDSKTYLIKLNENKMWHDGKRVTAKDIEYTIDYIKSQESIYNDNVKNIENVEIVDDYIIKIYLKEKEENFEYMLCFPIICDRENIGTGSFYLASINSNEITIKKKDDVKELKVKIYKDMKEVYNAFFKGEIDILITKNINYENYIGGIGYNKSIICGRKFNYLKFNLNNKLLAKKEIIEAIKYGVNKNEIIKKIYNNIYLKAEFPLQYGSYLYSGDIEYEYNINKAQKKLEEAGWKYNR